MFEKADIIGMQLAVDKMVGLVGSMPGEIPLRLINQDAQCTEEYI